MSLVRGASRPEELLELVRDDRPEPLRIELGIDQPRHIARLELRKRSGKGAVGTLLVSRHVMQDEEVAVGKRARIVPMPQCEEHRLVAHDREGRTGRRARPAGDRRLHGMQ